MSARESFFDEPMVICREKQQRQRVFARCFATGTSAPCICQRFDEYGICVAARSERDTPYGFAIATQSAPSGWIRQFLGMGK